MKKLAKNIKKILIIVYALVLAGVMFFTWNYMSGYIRHLSAPHTYSWYKKTDVYVAKTHFVADVADTEELQEEGLSGRLSLGTHRAMLFVFDHPAKYSFWMKDMFINIDMVWLDANKKVIYIEKNVSPATYPKDFQPESDALYVLEFPSGTADNLKIKQGDLIAVSL